MDINYGPTKSARTKKTKGLKVGNIHPLKPDWLEDENGAKPKLESGVLLVLGGFSARVSFGGALGGSCGLFNVHAQTNTVLFSDISFSGRVRLTPSRFLCFGFHSVSRKNMAITIDSVYEAHKKIEDAQAAGELTSAEVSRHLSIRGDSHKAWADNRLTTFFLLSAVYFFF